MSAVSFGCPDCGGIGGDCTCPADETAEAEDAAEQAREEAHERFLAYRGGR
jgi:hypothetical protein